MWHLVERHTGQVGYQRGVKAEGLALAEPVIDCSGWSRVLLTAAMQAANGAAGRTVFRDEDIAAIQVWSDRIIEEVAQRTGFILEAGDIFARSLPRCAAIGRKIGDPAWANNHPRSRGINHIVQIVRRPTDDAAFVSESFGGSVRRGILLTALPDWLAAMRPYVIAGEIWAVDPFRMADRQP